MKLNNYCIIILSQTDGIFDELSKISDTVFGKLDAKGLMIITFSSAAHVKEITDYLKGCNRNFLLFDLDDEHSGFNILKEQVNYELFGKIPVKDDIMSGLNILTADTENVRWEGKGKKEKTIEELLDEAIKNEDYEKAAKLRDELNQK